MARVAFERFAPPEHRKVFFKLEMSAEFNITPFVAQQKTNRFLLLNVGHLLKAGEPNLVFANQVYWDVPVLYTLPDRGTVGEVGHILMDVDSGDMVLDKSTKIEELERNAERLYQEEALSAGA